MIHRSCRKIEVIRSLQRHDVPCMSHKKGQDQPAPQRKVTRRAFGRLGTELVLCSLGPVLDIGGGGMRVLAKRPPREEQFKIEVFDGTTVVDLQVKMVWRRKLGLWRHEIGLAFVDLDEGHAQELTRLAMTNRMRRVI